jgi:hypothetical protein
MNEKVAIEMLVRSARRLPTYPFSRALTHPATSTIGGAAVGNLVEPGAGALAGGAVGYLMNKVMRFIHARGLVSRAVAAPERLMAGEESAIRKAMGMKEAAARQYESPYPWSEMLTSRAVGGGLAGGRSAVAVMRDGGSGPEAALAAGVGSVVGAGYAALKRSIYARALKGRIEMDGAGLTGTEREMVSGLRRGALQGKVIRGAKGAAILAALGLGAYGAKKLLTKNEA